MILNIDNRNLKDDDWSMLSASSSEQYFVGAVVLRVTMNFVLTNGVQPLGAYGCFFLAGR